MMYDAGGDLCQKEAKEIKCPTLILHPGVLEANTRCCICILLFYCIVLDIILSFNSNVIIYHYYYRI